MRYRYVLLVAMVFALMVLLLAVEPAQAGIFDTIKNASKEGGLWAAVAAVVLLYIFKKIPNEKIQKVVGKFAYGLGVGMTLGLAKWPFTAPLWNATIEPWFVDIFDNTVGTFAVKFIEGLRSDVPGGA